MFDACVELTAEYSAIEERLADPAVHADPAEARRLARRHAELRPTIEAYRTWLALGDDIAAARELADVDPAFADEADALDARRLEVAERLRELLIPRDPLDGKDVILEIKAGEAARSRPSSLATCCGCTCAMRISVAGVRRCSRPRSPTSAAIETSRWP